MRFYQRALLVLLCTPLLSVSYAGQSTERNSRIVPECGSYAEYQRNKGRYVEMEPIGMSLFIPRAKQVRLKKVPDVDYVLYIFSYGAGKQASVMQGWFGPYASNRSVREKSLQQSSKYTETWAMFGDRKVLDTFGQTTDGKHWRYLDLGSSALYYEDASEESASAFDSMLAKMCYKPWKL